MNNESIQLPSPVQKVDFDFGCTCFVKRDDFIHPDVSGNKYRKLKYLIKQTILLRKAGIITFGGAFSNHIYATAAYAAMSGLQSIGFIRGEDDEANPTFQFARAKGMTLHFVSRQDYKSKSEYDIVSQILPNNAEYMIIPEGGDHPLALKGVEEVITELDVQGIIPDYLAVSAGSGTTAVGLLKGIKKYGWDTKLIVMSAINSTHLYYKILEESEAKPYDIHFFSEYSLGGYAKTNEALINLMHEFYIQTGIHTDPIYTGKLVYGLKQLASKHFFKTEDLLLWIHTGGLQGIAGYNYMMWKRGNSNRFHA